MLKHVVFSLVRDSGIIWGEILRNLFIFGQNSQRNPINGRKNFMQKGTSVIEKTQISHWKLKISHEI